MLSKYRKGLAFHFMVQRKRRIVKPPAPISGPQAAQINLRKYSVAAAGILGVVLALWFITSVFQWLFSAEEVSEKTPQSPVIVEVLNGCGVSGVAGEMADFLRANNIDSLTTGNADDSEYPETIIIERDSVGSPARIISGLTGVARITYDYVSESPADVTIILGKDYGEFKPFKK